MSLHRGELIMALEIEFNVAIPEVDWVAVRTPNDVTEKVLGCIWEQNRQVPNRDFVTATVKQLILAGVEGAGSYDEDADIFEEGWIE